jgi:hypothetical protein
MDLFSELITAVQSDMTIGNESTLFPLATVKLALNRSYRRAGALFRWPETEDAKKTSTVIDQEYYDYPDTWRPDSIWKLKVDGVDYGDPLDYKDYLYEQENDNPSGLTYMWATQWRRFFIDPVPTTNGSNNICVWGQKSVPTLVNDSDLTIFSYSMAECNDAIVLEAVSILKSKGKEKSDGEFINLEAKGILTTAWGKLRQEKSKFEKTQPKFEVPDFFAPGARRGTRIGDFN